MSVRTQSAPMLVAGDWREADDHLAVVNPYDESVVATVSLASAADVDEALDRATAAFEATRRLPSHERARILAAIALGIRRERDALVATIVAEAGKPVRDARAEVDRHAFAFEFAAEEAKRIEAEYVPMDWAPLGEGRFGIVRRVPIGPVLGITPFNFPLNLVGHKLAPSIAAGNPVVLKPASKTPLSALALARLALEAGWPPAALSVLPCAAETIEPFVTDERVKKVSFTGSAEVGWRLKRLGWRKRVTLELGGNAGVVVHDDADLERAVERVTIGGFTYAGQSCISVQRVYVQRSIWPSFRDRLIDRVGRLTLGDPADESTDIGPMISAAAAERSERLVSEAVEAGAKVLIGGRREGSAFSPTVLENCDPAMSVCRDEAFAPILATFVYDSFEDALTAVDTSRYGLQAGVFTKDITRIWRAHERLEVGGLMVNEVPTWRMDHMPYGGVKESGWGREGIKYAIAEMTEPRLVVVTL